MCQVNGDPMRMDAKGAVIGSVGRQLKKKKQSSKRKALERMTENKMRKEGTEQKKKHNSKHNEL